MRIGLRLVLAFLLVVGLAMFAVLRVFLEEVKPGTRLAMEDSLIDSAHGFAQLAAPDLKAGRMADGEFAQAMRRLASVNPQATISGFNKSAIATRVSVTDSRGIVVFDSGDAAALGTDHSRWNDVLRTLRGEYGARSSPLRLDTPDNTVMHVAAPIRDGTQLIGVLTVSRPNSTLEPYIERSRDRILAAAGGLLVLTLAIGGLLTWWIARSMQRLQAYALAVAGGERVQPPRMGRFSGNTEFADLAQAVERMRLELEDKAYVENYVHTLTHELKSPLAAIQGAAELLEEPLPEAERRRFAANVQRQAERLKHLVDRLLGLAAVEQMRGLKDVEPLDLATLTQELLHALEPRLQRKGLKVQADLGAGGRVRGNRFLVTQALNNLLDNAIEFSPPGGELVLRLQRDGAWIEWSLLDGGPGVPDYALPRIFERFYSLPRGEAQERSSGLGLCLVQEVSALHGGEVRVENVVDGQGAVRGCSARWRLPAV